MQEEKEMSQSELIKLRHKRKMGRIANAISGFSRDTLAAGFVRIASDLLNSDEEIDNLIQQLNQIEKEITK